MIAHDPYLDELVAQGHQRIPHVRAHLLDGTDLGPVPVANGQVSFDLTRAGGLRAGTLEVPLYGPVQTLAGYQPGYWAPSTPTDPLAPFGQYVNISFEYPSFGTIDLGDFPILGCEVARPSGAVVVSLGDWAFRHVKAIRQTPRRFGPTWTAADTIVALLETSSPFPTSVVEDATNGATLGGEGVVINAGTPSWDIASDIAADENCYLYYSAPGELRLVRNDMIGTPTSQLRVGQGGTLIGYSSDINILTAVNKVRVSLESEASGKTFTATRTLTTGPMAYDPHGFGGFAEVFVERVDTANPGKASARADYLADRLFGAARQLDLEASPMPWIECGDTVEVVGPNGAENAVVEAITLPLTTEAPMHVITRTERTQTPGPFRSAPPTFMGAT